MFNTLGFQGGRWRQCLLKVTFLRVILHDRLLTSLLSALCLLSFLIHLSSPFFPSSPHFSSLSSKYMLGLYYFFLKLEGTLLQGVPNLAHQNHSGSSLKLQILVLTPDSLNQDLSMGGTKGFMFGWLAKLINDWYCLWLPCVTDVEVVSPGMLFQGQLRFSEKVVEGLAKPSLMVEWQAIW